jgi:hypothetical protein
LSIYPNTTLYSNNVPPAVNWGLGKYWCYSKTSGGQANCENALATTGQDPLENVCYWGKGIFSGSTNVTVTPYISPTNAITDVLTGNVTNLTDISARVSGSANPGGDHSAVGYFRYSTVAPESITPVFCNDIYGSDMKSTWEVPLGGVNEPVTFSTTLINLAEDSTYYYCAVASGDNQIAYGGVKSFTTRLSSSSFSVATEKALVIDGTSAYLNGSYNTAVPATTYFQYREKGKVFPLNPNINSVSHLPLENFLPDFLKPAKVLAATVPGGTLSPWIKVGGKSRGPNSYGKFSFLLTGLSPNTIYEFAAVISADDLSSNVLSRIVRGNTLSFTTKPPSSVFPGEVPGGEGYLDPCANIDDINCNGTGGGGGGGGGLQGFPDLIAGAVSPNTAVVNVSTLLSAVIKNQGDGETGKSFFNFFQISATNPSTPAKRQAERFSFRNFFRMPRAVAKTTSPFSSNLDDNIINLSAISTPALGGKMALLINTIYTFPSTGIYYARACADKKSISDPGVIAELYENNNCGPWTKINVGTGVGTGTGTGTGSGAGTWTGTGTGTGLTLGQTATPPDLAIVRYREGIEHVFVKQMRGNSALVEAFGYQAGDNLETFVWNLADQLARQFGYVSPSGKEIRVGPPDRAAYQLEMVNGVLTVYEYFDYKIVNIQSVTANLRNIYDYEYYFVKR